MMPSSFLKSIGTQKVFLQRMGLTYKEIKSGSVHLSVTCNGCGQSPLLGTRYKCLNCDINLCAMCAKITSTLDDLSHIYLRYDHISLIF